MLRVHLQVPPLHRCHMPSMTSILVHASVNMKRSYGNPQIVVSREEMQVLTLYTGGFFVRECWSRKFRYVVKVT